MRSGGPRAQAGRMRTVREHELNEDAVHAPCWLARHVQSEYERCGEGTKVFSPHLICLGIWAKGTVRQEPPSTAEMA